MAADPHSYIRELPLPALEYADSEEFEREVARVQAKLAQKEQEKAEGKFKRKELGFPEVPKKLDQLGLKRTWLPVRQPCP